MSSPTAPTVTCPHCGAAVEAAYVAGAREASCPQCHRPIPPGTGRRRALVNQLVGVGLAALGAYTIYHFLYEPWQQIEAMAPQITLVLKASFGGPLILGLGLAFLLPERPKEGETESFARRLARKAVLTFMIAGSLAGAAAYFWLRALARAHGYDL